MTTDRGRPSNAAIALHQHRFDLLENDGAGNCLFHALEGTRAAPSLDARQMRTVRSDVANVMANAPASPRRLRGNAHAFEYAMLQRDPRFIETKDEVTNHDMADYQRQPGNYAGNMEIEQWLQLPANHEKEVVILDVEPGNEHISVLKRVTHPQTGEVAIHTTPTRLAPSEFTGERSAAEIRRVIAEKVYGEAVDQPGQQRAIPPRRIVLYRTLTHFERVAGIRTEAERDEAAAARAANLREMARAQRIGVDISTLGRDTRQVG